MAIPEITKNRAIVHYKYFLRSLRKVSVHYGVGKSTLARWLHERGIKKPIKRQRRCNKLTEEMNTFIESTVSSNPCHTAQDLSRLLQERFCMNVSRSTIARRLKSMQFSWKRLRRRVVNKASISKFDYDAFNAGYTIANRGHVPQQVQGHIRRRVRVRGHSRRLVAGNRPPEALAAHHAEGAGGRASQEEVRGVADQGVQDEQVVQQVSQR